MSTNPYPTVVHLSGTLTDVEATALSELCRRIGLAECRSLSKDEAEAYRMRDATISLHQLLERHGY